MFENKQYITHLLRVENAGDTVSKSFLLPRKYKSIHGLSIKTSTMYTKSFGTIEILLNKKEIVAKDTPVSLFFISDSKNIKEGIFDYIKENIDEPNIEVTYSDLSASISYPYYIEITFLVSEEEIQELPYQYIIQPYNFQVTGAGDIQKVFNTFPKYNKVVAFCLTGINRDDSKRYEKFGLKVGNETVFATQTPLQLVHTYLMYSSLQRRFTPFIRNIDNTTITINHKDVDTHSIIGDYYVCFSLLIRRDR